jgi:sugar phosphate isomerase/epimerase
MSKPIGIQLYSVREFMDKDFVGTVRKVAAMGYDGVETAGFPGITPQEAAKLFKELGLQVPSAHVALPIGEKKNEILDQMATIGCKRLVCPSISPQHFKSMDGIRKAADMLNEGSQAARANGMSVGYHNHYWEFQIVEGRFAYNILRGLVSPDVFFQVDTYWVTTAGADVIQLIEDLGKSAPLLHIKDGPCVKDKPMLAVGEGKMDVPGILRASKDSADWLIVELDSCATDMLVAVEKSYKYLADFKF